MTDRNADRMARRGFEDEEDDSPVHALTREEAQALQEEGIEVMSVPLPPGLADGLQ